MMVTYHKKFVYRVLVRAGQKVLEWPDSRTMNQAAAKRQFIRLSKERAATIQRKPAHESDTGFKAY